jgi:hypothetical protein
MKFKSLFVESSSDCYIYQSTMQFPDAVLAIDLPPFTKGDQVDVLFYDFTKSTINICHDGSDYTFDANIGIDPTPILTEEYEGEEDEADCWEDSTVEFDEELFDSPAYRQIELRIPECEFWGEDVQ